MDGWFVVHCKQGGDREAAENLVRQAYEVYRPMINRRVKRKGNFETEKGSLFPRYLFIKRNFGEINSMAVNSTRGVNRLIAFSGINAQISDEDIKEMMSREQMMAAIQERRGGFENKINAQGGESCSRIPREIFSGREEERIKALLSIIDARMCLYETAG